MTHRALTRLTCLFALILTILMVLGAGPSCCAQPGELQKDAALEQRAQNISKHLRCPGCQSQTIDESDTPTARDLRILLRERLRKGDSDEQAVAYLVQQYGKNILLKPGLSSGSLVWLAFIPLIILLGLMALVMAYARKKQSETLAKNAVMLSAKKQAHLDKILAEHEGRENGQAG